MRLTDFANGVVDLTRDAVLLVVRLVLWTFVLGGVIGLLAIGWRAL